MAGQGVRSSLPGSKHSVMQDNKRLSLASLPSNDPSMCCLPNAPWFQATEICVLSSRHEASRLNDHVSIAVTHQGMVSHDHGVLRE